MARTAAEETPLMQQHKAIKDQFPDAILLFRVGDFYETFSQDARIASQVLGIVLTRRANGAASFVELAGFPHHALEGYLNKLVKAGHRVAVCDQLEDPRTAKGIVKRGVTEIITPGTTLNDRLLEAKSNNFLAAVHFGTDRAGISFLDLSTGEFIAAEGSWEEAGKLLRSFQPSETLFSRTRQKEFRQRFGSQGYGYALDDWIFSGSYATELLLRQFDTHSLKGFGVADLELAQVAAGAIIHYLKETEHPQLGHVRSIQRLATEDYLWMDQFTIRNLELLAEPGKQDGSLLKVLDHCLSPMGSRMMRRWMLFPLKDPGLIRERLDGVECLVRERDFSLKIAHHLKQVGDLERMAGKIARSKISPRELVQLSRNLAQVEAIGALAEAIPLPSLACRLKDLDGCPALRQRIVSELEEDAPVLASKGGLIRPGVSAELDALRAISREAKECLAAIQQKEAIATGIPSLKVAYNNIFGYYLEVTNAHKSRVPASWSRKQTLTGSERYITPELREFEEKITGAQEKILTLEQQLFDALIQDFQGALPALQQDARNLAVLDGLLCFASNACAFAYRRPEIHEGLSLKITGGRHPVIERLLPDGETYVANDLELDPETQQIIILTGPNMSGKSALLRQTALITLMAHMGSFVPATAAHIPVTDRIFTRVGASDNLAGGESTFLVEMNETAGILNNITPASLVLLDEIGRGTSTYDGISIAWSIVTYLHDMTPVKPKTLFATHYHELNDLEQILPRVRNFHITHRETGNQVIFLRKLEPGGSRHSFGIQVARMAGMPAELVEKAHQVLEQLEQQHGSRPLSETLKKTSAPAFQLKLFEAEPKSFAEIRRLMEQTDVDHLTPVEALLRLQQIKEILR